MTFEEWVIWNVGSNWKSLYTEEAYSFAERAWNAAKEDSKPETKAYYVECLI